MTRIATLPSPTVEEIVTRAGRADFDRWAEQVARVGTVPARYGSAAALNIDRPAVGGSVTRPTVSRIACC